MRKKLTVVQIVCILFSGLLPFFDKMINWKIFDSNMELLVSDHYSLYHVMTENIKGLTVTMKGLGPVIFWLFSATLVFMAVYCFSELFFEEKLKNNTIIGSKGAIILSILPFILGLIMIIIVNSYSNDFPAMPAFTSASVFAYVELILLAVIPLIELYIIFKFVGWPKHIPPTIVNHEANQSNVEELKKYKKLLDTGAITKDEFDAKKKQLLEL